MKDWIESARAIPQEGLTVEAMDSGGHVQPLVLKHRLWWFPDMSMYVYFVPKFWRPIAKALKGEKHSTPRSQTNPPVAGRVFVSSKEVTL